MRNLENTDASGFFDLTASVEINGAERPMTFRRFGDHPALFKRADTFDPFAVALLIPAMLRGVPLVIAGSVDELLLLALRGPIQDTLRLLAPEWQRVPIEAEPRQSNDVPDYSKGAAGAMSAGVDSMHLVRHRLLDPDVPAALRLKLLTHHHVGSHGDDDGIFEEQYAHVRRVADTLKLPLVGARCSMTDYYQDMPFNHCHTMRNIAASMTLDHLFTWFHYASSEEAGRPVKRSRFSGISTLEPQLLPLFNTTRVFWSSFGGGTTRLRKTDEVIADDRLNADLLVCIRGFRKDRGAINCGRCYKCARLLLQAEATGRLEAVAGPFDMPAYWAGRNRSVFRALRYTLGKRRTLNEIDILKYLMDKGFSFPLWSRPGVAIARLIHGTRHSLRM